MNIVFRKGSDPKSGRGNFKKSTLHITRDDGTNDWSYIHPGLLDHDIAHYAAETELNMQNGFFGIINKGAAIADFELPKDKKDPLVHPDTMDIEAIQSEYIVNHLQTEIWNTGQMVDFIEVLRSSLDIKNIPFPIQLTKEKLEIIRKVYHHYALEFHSLNEGETLELQINF